MPAQPIIAIFDVGKTNKKLFLFDENYKIIFEHSARFNETIDDDGDPCENVENLRLFVLDSLHEVIGNDDVEIRAINCSAYGASFVHLDYEGIPVTPLYNYLKSYPEDLKKQFYNTYGGEKKLSEETASPVLGHLNSGMQLYWLKYAKSQLYKRITYSLHLPQYISYLISGNFYSDITSIGCHTNLWNFKKNDYHQWVYKEDIYKKLAPVVPCNHIDVVPFDRSNCFAGIGIHDSSAALIPYLINFNEDFILISTGTWNISLNPFNNDPLSIEELKCDCLSYMTYEGNPVKASRLFAGNKHEQQLKRIESFFNKNILYYKAVRYNPKIINDLKKKDHLSLNVNDTRLLLKECPFQKRDIKSFSSFEEAYHQLIADIITQQYASTQIILKRTAVKRIFVDGGFSKNDIYMNMLAQSFHSIEVYSASMAQATALGTALAIHNSWNKKAISNNLIELKYYPAKDHF